MSYNHEAETETETDHTTATPKVMTRGRMIDEIVDGGGKRERATLIVDHLIDRGVYKEFVTGELRVRPLAAAAFTVKLAACRHVPGFTPAYDLL